MMTNSGGGECPSQFLCVKDYAMASSISPDDPIPDVSFHWTAEEGAIYYIYLWAPDTLPGPGYNLSVNKYEDKTSAAQSHLRKAM